MAGPLNGLGSGQQIPLANTFQPGGQNDQVRPEDNRRKEFVQARGAAAAQSQNTETGNQNATRARLQTTSPANDQGNDKSAKKQRGSLLDVTV